MFCNSSTPEIWDLFNNTKSINLIYFIIISSITMIISTFGVSGNCIVIWYLMFKIKRNFSTVYILNLAIADAVLLLFIIIIYVLSLAFFGQTSNEIKIDNVYHYITLYIISTATLFAYNTSLCLLTAISVERCLSVILPVWYHCKRPQRLSSIVCTAIWLLSCLFTILESTFCRKQLGIFHEAMCDNDCTPVFVLVCCISFIFIPLIIISNLAILLKICTRSKQKQPQKLYIVITLTVLFFLVFAMPIRILVLVFYKHQIIPPFPVIELFSLLSCLNSSINPFVYYLVGRQGIGSRKINFQMILQAIFHEEGHQYKKQNIKGNTLNLTIMSSQDIQEHNHR
ncbi:proto-oncogene Mas-like [Bombina bombina]|uniref:proto-oncogene Mas-like n=1 Tax=Bombina bombina TaxID=8345 RepID=UPI00235AE78F|nr:proto-oncogene Mas-like [Bombina bombina]